MSATAFAPFGDVVAVDPAAGIQANQGTALRVNRCAPLVNARTATASPNLAVFRSVGRQLPVEIRLFERHPDSTQTFLPLQDTTLLVVVAPSNDDDTPDFARARAFLTTRGQGVNYACGTWHHPIVVIGETTDLAMLAFEDGTARDCQEYPLPDGQTLVVTN